MQTAAIRALRIDAVYRSVPVPPDEWGLFLTQAKALPLSGFNITVPYKEMILKKGEHSVPWGGAAHGELGAANTVSRSKSGWKAFNTDVGGLQDDLMAQGIAFDGKNAVLLGSGGAARAAVVALAGSARAARARMGPGTAPWRGRRSWRGSFREGPSRSTRRPWTKGPPPSRERRSWSTPRRWGWPPGTLAPSTPAGSTTGSWFTT